MSNASDFIIENGVLKEYVGPGGDVIIPEGVTKIGNKVFEGRNDLTGIVIPDGVTTIRSWTFRGCRNLTTAVIPESVSSIGPRAFFECGNLSNVRLPASASVADNAFHGCAKLADADGFVILNGILFGYYGAGGDVVIPTGVTHIGEEAFCQCHPLISVTIPEGVNSIGVQAFHRCAGLARVILPASLRTIDNNAFSYSRNLSDCLIPEGVTHIGVGAFSDCNSLKSITIPSSVTEIGASAFHGCAQLECVEIEGNMVTLSGGTFAGCRSLKKMTISPTIKTIDKNAVWATENLRISIEDISILPVDCRKNALLCYLDDGVSADDPRNAGYMKFIKSNAEKLADLALSYPGMLAMMCREKLLTAKTAEIYMSMAQTRGDAEQIALLVDYIGSKLTAKQKARVEQEKEKQADKVIDKMIARRDKEGIEGLVFAVSGKLETFGNRNDLKEVIQKNGGKLVTSVSANVDYLIINDKDADTGKHKDAVELGVELMSEARFNEIVKRHFVINKSMDKGLVLKKYIGPGGEVILPDGIRTIGEKAFSGCRTVTQVRIPESVMQIADKAFYRCPALTDVFIANRRTRFDMSVFEKSPKTVIHAAANSHVENYAKKNNIPFVAE